MLTLLLQAPELYAFAVVDATSYYLFVVNEDEAAPAETTLNLKAWSDVPPGLVVIACLVADGCARAWPRRLHLTLPLYGALRAMRMRTVSWCSAERP